jgi:septum formation inhibitor MinC
MFLVFSAWVTKHDKRTNQIEVNVSRKFRMLKAFPNAGTLTLDLSVTKKNCRCNKLLGKKKARRFLILASSEGGSLKVKAMKKMEKKQEIEKMAKQC